MEFTSKVLVRKAMAEMGAMGWYTYECCESFTKKARGLR
jgi:hypothetical protein